MSKVISYFAGIFEQLFDALRRFYSRVCPNDKHPSRDAINQMNAIISYLPEKERKLVPLMIVEYFAEHADLPPSQSLDRSKPLKQQNIADDTLLLMYYVNMIIDEAQKSGAETEDELHRAQVKASKAFIAMLNGERTE